MLRIIYSPESIPYREAYQRQKEFHSKRIAGDIPDTLWMLEHPPVLTIGLRKNQKKNLLIDPEHRARLGIDVVETERGGEITYHGPGQLVGYLFVDIANFRFQVKKFVRSIEEAFIFYLDKDFGISANHDAEHTGIWVRENKITAIGIALKQKITLHGFAFNVNTDLSHFQWIVPCGISDRERGVTSLKKIVGHTIDMRKTAKGVGSALCKTLGYNQFEEMDFSIL